MGVVMKGGTSGNREDALPKVSVAFDKQEPQNTATNSYPDSGVKLSIVDENRHIPGAEPPVPKGGTPNDAAV
jgi:hypothetical protein